MADRVRTAPSKVSLEDGLRLRQLGPDTFTNIQTPWTWAGTPVVPGGILMSLAAAAAYETVSSAFAIDMLQAQFLAGPTSSPPLALKVQRLSDGGRFCSRAVRVEQDGKLVVFVTCSFANIAKLGGPSMQHSVSRATEQRLGPEGITLDDLDIGRTDMGPWMKFQRLPLSTTSTSTKLVKTCDPSDIVYTSAARIDPPIASKESRMQNLGMVALSDYHILDCPPHVHCLSLAQPAIGDATRRIPENDFTMCTSMNHTIHFHIHEGFKADEVCYIEARSQWTANRRGYITSRIFTGRGSLVATCSQEAYYVLKEGKEGKEKL